MDLAVLGLVFSLASPLLLIPIEKILPWPYVIEEVVKLIIVVQIIKAENKTGKKLGFWILSAGVLFTVSESILYLINIFALGDISLLGKRMLFTGILHIGTFYLLYKFGRKNFYSMSLSLFLAIGIHYLFNLVISLY